MPTYSQQDRLISVSTPLGKDALLLETFKGEECLSDIFEYELALLAEPDTDIAFDQILGQPVTVTLLMPIGDKQTRYFNGIVSRFGQAGQLFGPDGTVTFVRYTAQVVPQFWLLQKNWNSRIFQQLSVPDILKQVLTGLNVAYELQGTFEKRDYCVQYRETDFDFANRLMEEEGIYYYFDHADGSHTMVVANTPSSHRAVPAPTTIRYDTTEGGVLPDTVISQWEKSQEIQPGKATLWDHSFELPGQNLEAKSSTLESVAVGTVTHKLKVGGNDKLEVYDYPGAYAQRFDGIDPGGGDQAANVQKIFTDNTRTVGIRMQQETVLAVLIQGQSNCPQLSAGHKFTLSDHFNANGDYVLTRVEHKASIAGSYTSGDSVETYANTFAAIPSQLPYRPEQETVKPVIHGTQTAVVVGPAGQEIFTDKYSRVKVQFPWDRLGKNDANSACWVRVMTHWAGQQWGLIHIPRIGQEVAVAFEEGDPDRPIIVGSVYNAQQMPPYTLPDNATQSGVKTRSSLKGTSDNFNELRFEDKKGSEEIYFHAEKDFNRYVENNDTLKVGFDGKDKGDRTVEIFNNHNHTVGAGKDKASVGNETAEIWNNQVVTIGSGKGQCADGSQNVSIYKDRTVELLTGNDMLLVDQGDRTVVVKTGNDTHTIKTGNRVVKIDQGDDDLDIKTGDRNVIIDTGNDLLKIKAGNQTTKIVLGSSSTEAMDSITLKVGQNSIVIDQTGVTIKGLMVSIQGQVQTEVKSLLVNVTADAMCKVGGGITMIG